MSNCILDKAYTVTETDGVAAYRVVVQGANAGECALPGAQNADKILGVTTHAQDVSIVSVRNIFVRKSGIARVEAAGAVAVGDAVNVAGTTGKIKSIGDESIGTKVKVLGFAETAAQADGDIIEVFIAMHERTIASDKGTNENEKEPAEMTALEGSAKARVGEPVSAKHNGRRIVYTLRSAMRPCWIESSKTLCVGGSDWELNKLAVTIPAQHAVAVLEGIRRYNAMFAEESCISSESPQMAIVG